MYRTRFLVVVALMLFSARMGLGQTTKTAYPFKVSPVATIERMDNLPKPEEAKFALTEEEISLLVAAQKGPSNDWSFAEAALLASGVKDRESRTKYLARIDQLCEDASQVVNDADSPFAKGEKLLQFLHTGPMKKYSSNQTSVAEIFDSGKFNCVSSAVLYNIVALRLGLEVRGVMAPGHMFSRVYDGEVFAPVETTNKKGFNFEKKYSKAREVGEYGSVAAIYGNTAAPLNNKKHYRDAILAFLCILALEPDSADAAKCIKANFASWSAELAKAGKYQEGLQVTAFGLELDPANRMLENNQKFIRAKLTNVP